MFESYVKAFIRTLDSVGLGCPHPIEFHNVPTVYIHWIKYQDHRLRPEKGHVNLVNKSTLELVQLIYFFILCTF